MKIHGRSDFQQSATVKLLDDVPEITVRPLSATFSEEMELRLPRPQPPVRLKESQPGRYLKDENGKFVSETDENDPKYRAASVRHGFRQTMLAFYYATADDPNVVFEAPEPASDADPAAWEVFCDALLTELEAAGLAIANLSKVGKVIAQLSGVSDEQLAAAAGESSPAA